MKKAPEAFRTISEVAEILDTPAHVLRFWESKFYQIRPVKRAGGRRYYRPDDVALINGIKTLLQVQGMTIRGVQRVLQEQGAKHVATQGGPLPEILATDDPALEGRLIDPSELPMSGLGDPPDEPVPERALAHRPSPRPLPVTVAESVENVPLEPTEGIPAVDRPAKPEQDTPEPSDSEPFPAEAELAEPEFDAPTDDETVEPEPEEDAAHAAAAVVEIVAEASALPEAIDQDDTDLGLETEHHPGEPPTGVPAPPATEVTPETPPEPEEVAPAPPLTPPRPLAPAADAAPAELLEASERAQIARRLRTMPRASLGPRRDRAELLARRIDALLERMSEASGAGRW